MLEEQFYLLTSIALALGVLSFASSVKGNGWHVVLPPGLALLSSGLWTILGLSAVAIEVPVNTWLWNANTSNATLATATIMYRSLNVHWIYYMFATFFFLWFVFLCANTLYAGARGGE